MIKRSQIFNLNSIPSCTDTYVGGREKKDAKFYGGGVRRKQTYEVELRRAIRKMGVGRGRGRKTRTL